MGKRLNSHKYDISNNLDKPVSKHFNSHKHCLKHVKIYGIEQIKCGSTVYMRIKKQLWIKKIDPKLNVKK